MSANFNRVKELAITVAFCLLILMFLVAAVVLLVFNARPSVTPDTLPDTVTAEATLEETTTTEASTIKTNTDAETIFVSADEVIPTLDATCPYEISKCVSTVSFENTNWDVYLYILDGIIGTWIVNDTGNQISFYGDAYSKTIDNFNVHMSNKMCVYPFGENDESFMVVTY